MNITNSPDISVLKVKAILDLSVTPAVIRFENQSNGAQLANVKYIFEMRSPNNTPFYTGNFATPDRNGVWTSYNSPAVIPTFKGGIETSESTPYSIIVKARDSAGVTFTLPPIKIYAARPAFMHPVNPNYGLGVLDITVDCNYKEAYIKDITAYSYRGVKGTKKAGSQIIVQQPIDETGVSPQPIHYEMFSQVTHPLALSGQGYNAVLVSVVDYDMSEDVTIRMRYMKTTPFDVNCNVDLTPILVEFAKLVDINAKVCKPELTDKISQISSYLVLATLAKSNPTSGLNLGDLIAKIKRIGGWDCNCNGPIGLNGSPITGGNGNGVPNFQFSVAGDIAASVGVTGNNVMFTIGDKSYVIAIDQTGYTAGFTVSQTTSANNKTFAIRLDLNKLTEDILKNVKDTPEFLNTFNSLIKNSFNFTVDGKCIINLNQSCKYSLSLDSIPSAPNTALFKYIKINSVAYPINISFSRTTFIPTLQTALNNLGKGTFAVGVSESGILSIVTNSNSNKVDSAVIFGAGQTADRVMSVTPSECTGTTSYSPSEIVQALIDYLCAIKADQVKIGYDVTFASVDAEGKVQDIVFKAENGNSLKDFIDAVNLTTKNIIGRLGSTSISYKSVVALFEDKTSLIKSTDVLFGTRDGKGGQWSISDLVNAITNDINTSNDVAKLAAWCAAVSKCSTNTTCSAVSFGEITIRAIQKEDFTFVGSDLVFNGFFTAHNVTADVTVNFQKVNKEGQLGATATLTMPSGSNKITGAIGTLPVLATGETWRIISITTTSTKKYVALKFQNSGAGSYEVAIRLFGSASPFAPVTYQAQPDQFTVLTFSVTENDYEAQIVSVCSVTKKSTALVVSSQICPAPLSFNVTKTGTQFTATYSFPSSVTKFNLTLQMPSGGFVNYTPDVASGSFTIPQQATEAGDYKFRVRAVCSEANSWYGPYSSQVTLSSGSSTNVPPTVNAGNDIVITLPTQTATAAATITPGSAGISQRAWTNTAKPNGSTPVIVDATVEDAVFNNLSVVGDYTFQLSATDSLGGSANDSMKVTVNAAQVQPFRIVTQPTSQDVPSGTPFSLSVTVADGTGPYNYTYRDVTAGGSGTLLASHTGIASTTDSLNGLTTTTTKQYRIDITDAAGLPLSSNIVTVSVALQLNFGYSNTNPYVNDTTIPTVGSGTNQPIVAGTTYTFTLPSAAQGTFVWLSYSATEPLRLTWSNGSAPGSGTINGLQGGQEFRQFVVGGTVYVVARNEFEFDANQPLSFTPELN